MFVFLFFLCIQTLWSEYKSLIRYIFCKYLLLLYGLFFYFINHAFFLYQTQLYTSVTVSAVQQSKSAIHIRALVAQLCPTLCDPMDCNTPYSSVHVILQAKLLEWVSMPFSRGLSQPRDRTQVSCTASGFFTIWPPGKPAYVLFWGSPPHLGHHRAWVRVPCAIQWFSLVVYFICDI